jgi:hypothetical protein
MERLTKIATERDRVPIPGLISNGGDTQVGVADQLDRPQESNHACMMMEAEARCEPHSRA